MSQLQKKSASFRSRIPVRRTRFSQRRCCSPHTFCSGPDGIKYPCGCPPARKLRTSRTFACAGVVPHRSNSHIFHSHRHPSQHSSSRRYSSSSFSSSDESCESEAPHQKLARQSKKVPLERSMYVSTDAISLDGLLDSVSCGSFSSPPSPVYYQNTHEPVCHRSSSYESLDKYNITLDNLQITENVPFLPYPLAAVRRSSENSLINQNNNKLNYRYNNHYNRQEEQIVVDNQLKSAFRQNIMSSEARHQLTRAKATTKPAGGDSRSANDEASKKSFYMEKQKQLSDWYYIKSKNVVLDDDSNDELNTRIGTVVKRSNGEPRGTHERGEIGSGDIETEDSLPEHNYVNCARQVSTRDAIKSGQPAAFASLSRRAALGSARYAAATCDEAQMNSLTQPTVRWNNFDRQQSNTTQQQQQQNEDSPQNHSAGQVRKYNVLDDIEAEYNEAVDAINSSELKSSSATTSQIKPVCPPYYCPPSYTVHHNHPSGQHQQLTSGVSAENVDLSNVNVRLLKQHYQQQYQQPQRTAKTSSEYANMSFRKRVEAGKRNKNKVELQLEHWESMGNNNSVTDVSQAKFRETATEASKARSGVTAGHKSTEESHPSTQQHPELKQHSQHQHQYEQQQQQQQQQQLSCSNVCFNNSSNAVVNATSSFSKNSNSRSSNCSDNINTLHNNHGTLNNQRTQQQHPGESSVSDQGIIQQQQNFYNQVDSREEDSDQDVCLRQPVVAPRRQPYPLTATHSKAPLRPRQLQKRPDETSCSSFEQLNIVGIPTSDDVEGEDCMHALNVDVDESTLAVSAAGGGCSPHDKYENHYYVDNADDREDRALKPVATDHSNIHGFLNISEDVALSAGVHNLQVEEELANRSNTSNRPLPEIPKQLQHQQIQLQLQQNPQTRQLFGIVDKEMYPPKTTPSCRSDCELSGSYASLECPSPPGPPISLPESRRDPQARLGTYLRTFYTDLSLKEPIIPQWAIPVAPGALCAARLEPELKLNSSSHGFSDSLTVDQILVSLQTKEGNFLEAPRRCLIECPSWSSRSNLCLRILHAWAKEPPWPTKGTPVALALLIPLAELKRSLAHYVEKELLVKGPLNPFSNGIGNFSAAWNSLEALGPKLLLVLDGYDSQKLGNPANNGGTPKKNKSNVTLGGAGSKHHYPNDVHDLLDGKLFPDARIIITTSTTTYPELLSIIQRHVTYEGLTWGRSASLLGGGQWGGPSRLLDVIQENVYLRKVVRTPLGCLAVTAIYDNSGGDLPTDELDITESILNCVAPEVSAIHVSELGRLALFCLKMKRPCFTLAEMRMYCSTPESALLGCLERNLLFGKTAKKKSEYVYHSICSGMMELLAANYIASLATRPGLLAAEITGMAVGDELDPDLLKVLKFAMTLLGDRAHVLLSRLTPLWLTPQIVFTLALAGGPAEDNLAALCDILGISKHPPISPLETKPLWVQVRSLPTDLMGWGMALKSPTCTLKNLEVIYQLEKHNLMESRKAIEIFLDSLIANESVSTLKLSSLIEMDVKDSEISYLANCVSKILLKPRLENFELVLTLLEEDPPILKLQSVVAALCRTIPRQPRLSFLLLDLTLSTSQLVQLCSTLEKCPNVTRLSLPHLRCERGAITALASLLNSRPINFLSLPSCWGARDDPPSSSGVSMGSGSGSSTGTSGLIKQGSLPGVPSPRSYAPGVFSSLPRGVFVPQSSLGRSATLPRQPLEQTLDKRSCDSVVSKTWYPTPACDGGPHNSGTLHDLLFAARDSYSKLHGLDLSKAQLSLEDSMCLGETVRLSNTLHTLKLEGSSRFSEVLPSVLGASESSCLQMLSIGSPRLSLEDSAIAMCARALSSCSTLRLLSLDGWSFRIENSSTLSILRAFLSLTSIRELSLANCRLQISLVNSDTKISHPFESRSVVVLKLAGAQATLADATIMRGPQLLQYIGGFPCLRELDLSAPARSGMGSTHTTPLILDDKCIINFFQNLHSHFGLLNTLKICHWVIHFDEMSKTLKAISKCMRNSPISHLKIDGISVLDRPKKQRSEVNFIHCFIASLPQIRWMGISLAGKKEEQITGIGNAVLDLKGYEIDIKLSESTIEHAKLMAQAISVDGKFDIKVSTFGTSSGILVHAEKSGTKSLTRK